MLTLLTMTGERPEAFALCQRWMARQTYTGPVRWIVVDDGRQESRIEAQERWDVEVIRPEPLWSPGRNTQSRNVLAGLEAAGPEARLVIIEDDDWYAPSWLEVCVAALARAELVGESHARYYNVAQRRARQLDNQYHASLCSTALRGEALNTLRRACQGSPDFIDIALWRDHRNKLLFRGSGVVGIKGLPGRPGIGVGHSPKFGGEPDEQRKILRSWIGADVAAYFPTENPE